MAGAAKGRAVLAGLVITGLIASALPARASSAGANRVTGLIRVLAKSGIATVDRPTDTEPIVEVKGDLSPVRLLRDQVENMALELESDGGVPGSLLDELAPMPEGALPLSFLIAGYVTSEATPGAKSAKKIMGRQDWARAPDVAFPSVVLALFENDVARALAPDATAPPLGVDTGQTTAGGPAGGAARPTGAVASVCGTLSSFVRGGIAAVLEVLTFEEEGAYLSSLQKAWNAGVEWVFAKLGGVIGEIVQTFVPFLPAIRQALGVIAAVHAITSLLVHWKVNVKAVPSSAHFAVGNDPPKKGEFVATVTVPNNVDWPAGVPECAELLDITLPKLSAKDAPVQWLLFEDSIDAHLSTYSLEDTSYDADQKLNSQLQARLNFTVNSESVKVHDKGDLVEDKLIAQLTVPRTDVAQLRTLLHGLVSGLVGGLPIPGSSFIEDQVNNKIQNELLPLVDQLTEVAVPLGRGELVVEHHRLKPCSYPNSAVDPCLVGKWESLSLDLPLPPELSYSGGVGAEMRITTAGELTIDYEPSEPFSVSVQGLGGSGKWHGRATATIETEYETKGSGTTSTLAVDVSQAYAVLDVLGMRQTIGIGFGDLNGSYMIENLDDTVAPDLLTLTIPTSVGPHVSVWIRVA